MQPVADPAPPLPTGPNSFIFADILAEKRPCRTLVPLNGVGAPNGKSWIHH